jgi:hypothetical protein
MRPTTTSHRRLHPVPSSRRIDAIARLVDEGTVDDPHHVLVHVIDEGDDVLLGLKPLDPGTHPFEELAGFTAPEEWSMFGLRVQGTARHLDGSGPPPERTSTTFLVSRDGEERSILRAAGRPEQLAGPARGTIPDLCRRVLGLGTEPAPPTSAPLWTVAWLDRVIEAWGDPQRRRQIASCWAQVAMLHPAVRSAPGHDLLALGDPAELVGLARAHTAAWSWERLRAEPDALHLPDGHLRASITSWMDDGFYARWALGAFPDPSTLAHDLVRLLEPAQRWTFVEVLAGLVPGPAE